MRFSAFELIKDNEPVIINYWISHAIGIITILVMGQLRCRWVRARL